MSDQNLERFRKCAVEVLSVEPDQVTLEARFDDDLDADSLDLVELVMALEEEFDVTIEEEELEGVDTVGAAYELLQSKL
ncbi:MAG: Acyl carrier protein [Acidimicrobiales bacterium]|nr:MAG: acyl carrier protein [Actinomycetota bacterium]MBV6509540.1 Acyl carrier protein [Acidimicrobiales bacterium]RIK06595.1 MAG: acyl carrier protein [Acidobacteriota bacterium]